MTPIDYGLLKWHPETAADKLRKIQIEKVQKRLSGYDPETAKPAVFPKNYAIPVRLQSFKLLVEGITDLFHRSFNAERTGSDRQIGENGKANLIFLYYTFGDGSRKYVTIKRDGEFWEIFFEPEKKPAPKYPWNPEDKYKSVKVQGFLEKRKKKKHAREIKKGRSKEERILEKAAYNEKKSGFKHAFPKWLGPLWSCEPWPAEQSIKCILEWMRYQRQLLQNLADMFKRGKGSFDQHGLVSHVVILIKVLQKMSVDGLPGLDKLPLDYFDEKKGKHIPWKYSPKKASEVLIGVEEALEEHLADGTVGSDDENDEMLRQAVDSDVPEESWQGEEQPAAEFCFYPFSESMFYVKGFGEDGYVSSGLKGFRQIRRLLQSEGEPVGMQALLEIDAGRLRDDPRSEQPVFGPDEIQRIKTELALEKRALEKAVSDNDPAKADRHRGEIERIEGEVKAVTYRGKVRDLNSGYDTMRSKIHGTLQTAHKKFLKNNPPMKEIAEYFKDAISADGNSFVYRSPLDPSPSWNTNAAHSQIESD